MRDGLVILPTEGEPVALRPAAIGAIWLETAIGETAPRVHVAVAGSPTPFLAAARFGTVEALRRELLLQQVEPAA